MGLGCKHQGNEMFSPQFPTARLNIYKLGLNQLNTNLLLYGFFIFFKITFYKSYFDLIEL